MTGFKKTEYWTKADVEVHRDRFSKSRFNGPWKDNFDAMAKKTVLKSLLNHYGPMSVDSKLATAIQDDQKVYDSNGNGEYMDNPMGYQEDDIMPAEKPIEATVAEPPVDMAEGPESFESDSLPGFDIG